MIRLRPVPDVCRARPRCACADRSPARYQVAIDKTVTKSKALEREYDVIRTTPDRLFGVAGDLTRTSVVGYFLYWRDTKYWGESGCWRSR